LQSPARRASQKCRQAHNGITSSYMAQQPAGRRCHHHLHTARQCLAGWCNGVPRAMPEVAKRRGSVVSCVVDWLLSPLCSGVLALCVRATSRSGRSRSIRAPALKSRSIYGPPPAKASSIYIQATPLKKQVYIWATSCKNMAYLCLYVGHPVRSQFYIWATCCETRYI
jgi:hypothetical protein